ncbi:AEC family transporter [Saccharicrinis fermentans]|uniref:Auxin efflux carrier n=1 Tax=Saccharicrinis fermentans DSM 9555 = JCM 21142 TaxID=869213 RepID=W7YIY8_9BACT|nr:AEC family transporter [Saccharicrinis fermentans]GAF04441.1 auxin efflux carrier [Saccharicrinis fermentans DSM 9555 = JCM 21142]
MFQALFINVLSVFLMMIPGYLIIRKNIISESALKALSHIIIKVLYPCLIFSSITKNFTITKVLESWQLPVSIFVFCIIGYLAGLLYLGFFKCDDLQRRRSILFQMTTNNYSFLPLAIIAKLYGEQQMGALILSTLGAELAVWTLGISILNTNGGGFKTKDLKHLLSAPMVSIYFSLLILIGLHIFNMPFQNLLDKSLFLNYSQKTIFQMGQATIPISMIMVGGRMGLMKFSDLKILDLWGVALFRLILIPIIGVILLKQFFPDHPFLNVMLIVVVMPNSMASQVLGEIYGADTKLFSGTILITHLLSLISIPLWLLLLL